MATSEQLGTLLGDEEGLRLKYDSEERQFRRNEGRQVYENLILDWLAGEVVFDGKRWHLVAAAALALLCLIGVYFILLVAMSGKKYTAGVGAGVVKKKKTT